LFALGARKVFFLAPGARDEVAAEIRKRDAARLQMQKAEGSMLAGVNLSYKSGGIVPEPLTQPTGKSKALTEETQEALKGAAPQAG
jgi:hypothetical protein